MWLVATVALNMKSSMPGPAIPLAGRLVVAAAADMAICINYHYASVSWESVKGGGSKETSK